MWKPAGIRQSKESRSQQKSKDRKYWRLKGTGNLLESKLFFLLCPMQFYSRLNSLDLREGRREVRIHSRLSPTWAPMSRSQELRKDTERKHSRSPGWLRLVGSGCTDQHRLTKTGWKENKDSWEPTASCWVKASFRQIQWTPQPIPLTTTMETGVHTQCFGSRTSWVSQPNSAIC